MTIRIEKISVLALGKTLCCLHASVGLLMGLFVTVSSLAGRESASPAAFGVWSVLVLPLMNAVLGFVLGVGVAAAYNLLAPRVGGLEFQAAERT